MCADSELFVWSAGAGCGPAYTRCPSGAPEARGLVCAPAFLSRSPDATWSHHQGIRLGVFPVQPVQHHNHTMHDALERACDRHIQSLGVRSCDYNYGPVSELASSVAISINGRRYQSTSYLRIS